MELRFVTARSTRDLDFTVRSGGTESALDLNAAPYGGARYPVASGLLKVALCAEALRRTFELRHTHRLPEELLAPPAHWDRPFRVLAEECRLGIGYREAFDALLSFWNTLGR